MSEEAPHVQLTAAERCVLLRTIEGASTQDIALARAVSVHTIRAQIASIHRKLDVPTTTLAVVWGSRTGSVASSRRGSARLRMPPARTLRSQY